MQDSSLEKVILINLAHEPKSRREIRAASIGDSHTDELARQFNRVFDSLKASRRIKADGAGWHLTGAAKPEAMTLRTDPTPCDFRAVPEAHDVSS